MAARKVAVKKGPEMKSGPNGVNLRSWLFFIAIFPIISVYLWCCS